MRIEKIHKLSWAVTALALIAVSSVFARENLTDGEPRSLPGKRMISSQFVLTENADYLNRLISDPRTRVSHLGIDHSQSWNYHSLHQENFESGLGDYTVTGTMEDWDEDGGVAVHAGGTAIDYLTSPVFNAPNVFDPGDPDSTFGNSIILAYFGASHSGNDALAPEVNLVGDWHVDNYPTGDSPYDIDGSDHWWGGKPAAGGYESNDFHILTSTEIDLTEYDNAALEFTHIYGFEEWGATTGWDGCNVQVSADGGIVWDVIDPDQGYSAPGGVYALDPGGYPNNMMPGYTGQVTTPETVTFDLSDFAGGTILIRWVYAADGSWDVHSQSDLLGWIIDDITVSTTKSYLPYIDKEVSEVLLTEDIDTDNNFDNAAWAGLVSPYSGQPLEHVASGAYVIADISDLLLDASDDGRIRFGVESEDGLGSEVDDIWVLASDRYAIDLGVTAVDIAGFPFEVGQEVTFTVTATNMGMLPVRTFVTRVWVYDTNSGEAIYSSGTEGYFYAANLDGSDWFQGLDSDMEFTFTWTPAAADAGKSYSLVASTLQWSGSAADFAGDPLNPGNDAITKAVHIYPTGKGAFYSEDFTPLDATWDNITDFGWSANDSSNWDVSGNSAADNDSTVADTLYTGNIDITGGTYVWLEFDYSADTGSVYSGTALPMVLYQTGASAWDTLATLGVGSASFSDTLSTFLTAATNKLAFVSAVDYSLDIDNVVIYNAYDAVFDTTKPAAPSAMTATVDDQIATISWTASTSADVVAYMVYRGEDDTLANARTLDRGTNRENAIQYFASTALTSYTDIFVHSTGYFLTDLLGYPIHNDSTYHYWVTAVDAAGNESDTATSILVTPADTLAPTTVTDLYATLNGRHISLTWSSPSERTYEREFEVAGFGMVGYYPYTGYHSSEITGITGTTYDIRYSKTAPGDDPAAWWSASIAIDSLLQSDQSDTLVASSKGKAEELLLYDLAVMPTDYYFALKTTDEADNVSAISNIASRDKVPPASTFDLSIAAASTTDSVTLTWTAPGDDGRSGTAASYDIRYRYFADFTAIHWDDAFVAANTPAPSVAGSAESFTIKVVAGFAISARLVTIDESGHASELSNTGTYVPAGAGTALSIAEVGIPTEFGIRQNYPNPFNPVTRIVFALPEQSNVVLKVYNVLGQEIKELAVGEYAVGFHSVVWNATDKASNRVPSGIYFYRIEAGNFIKTSKMVLLK